MSTPVSSRRDARYRLRPGSSEIEFDDPRSGDRRHRLELTTLSVAGLAFECDQATCTLEPGTTIDNATIRVGPCEMQGHVTVGNCREVGGSRLEFGCLFYAIDSASQTLLMAVVAGIEASEPL